MGWDRWDRWDGIYRIDGTVSGVLIGLASIVMQVLEERSWLYNDYRMYIESGHNVNINNDI